MRAYIVRVLVAFDMLVNVIFGGLPDETISSRWQRGNQIGGGLVSRVGSIALTWLQPHHGSEAMLHDRERAQAVVDTESPTLTSGLESKNLLVTDQLQIAPIAGQK